jgi:CheY-like chemotaxis protein
MIFFSALHKIPGINSFLFSTWNVKRGTIKSTQDIKMLKSEAARFTVSGKSPRVVFDPALGAAHTLDPSCTHTILVVEDDPELRTLLEIMFEARGYHLLIAEDGRAGWELAKAHQGPIDLLLSDIVMPHMTGMELARRISKTRSETKVVLTSAYHQSVLLIDPNWTFVPKPYAPKMLIAKVEEMLAAGKEK